MQIKAGKKHIFICLLVCSLFITCYTGIFNPNSMAGSDGYSFSSSGGSAHSSMNSGTNLWHFNYLAITNLSSELFVSSIKQSQWLLTKTSLTILTSTIIALIICLIYSSRLAGSLGSQFSSIQITVFLHKKDGMK